jgi:hypothetical protein
MAQDQFPAQHLRDVRNVAELSSPALRAGAMPSSCTPAQHLHCYSSHHPPFSRLFPFLDPPASVSSLQSVVTDVLKDDTKTDQAHCRAHFKSPKEFEPRHSVQAMWPNFSPGYSELSLLCEKHSRLPPNYIGRKSPRKATSSPVPKDSPQSVISMSRLAQRRATKDTHRLRHASPLPAWHERIPENNTPKSATANLYTLERISLNESLPPMSARSQRVILDKEDEKSQENEEQFPRATIETGVRDTTVSRVLSASSITTVRNQSHSRPHPRLDYPISVELESVHRALGEDNWKAYLILIEQKCLGEIAEAECITRSKAIFTMFDESAQRRTERQLTKTVVMPVLEQHSLVETGDE